MGGAVASHVRSPNLTDARDRTSVERRSRYGPDCELFFLLMNGEPQ